MYIILTAIFILILFYYKLVKPVKYWEERDVPHTKSWPVVGSIKDSVFKKKHLTDTFMDIYNRHGEDRCVGYMQFTKPVLLIKDLELIKKITIKDFDHFHDHVALQSNHLLSKSLINLNGENWKRMRATLSPIFTSNKMQMMYELITECAKSFTHHFDGKEQILIEMKDVSSRFATNVIASTAFGITVDCLEDTEHDFFIMGKKLTDFGANINLKMFLMELAPSLANLLGIQMFTKDITDYFRSIVKDNITKRETEGYVRLDLIHLLMEARKGHLKLDTVQSIEKNFASVEEYEIGKNLTPVELTDDQIVAQALMFFLDGFETISTSSSFMAYELAVHPEVQKKLQLEIDAVNKEYYKKVPLSAILSMKYLDQVVCETLRLWPPKFQIDRLCVKDYVIEPKTQKEKVVFVPKGTTVMIPIFALHHDRKYFQDPYKFNPERFNEENRLKIISETYLPFGIGPRNCMASRFALLEIKCLFFHLLSKFIIIPVDETEIPLKISSKKINMTPDNGFKLGFKPRIKM